MKCSFCSQDLTIKFQEQAEVIQKQAKVNQEQVKVNQEQAEVIQGHMRAIIEWDEMIQEIETTIGRLKPGIDQYQEGTIQINIKLVKVKFTVSVAIANQKYHKQTIHFLFISWWIHPVAILQHFGNQSFRNVLRQHCL